MVRQKVLWLLVFCVTACAHRREKFSDEPEVPADFDRQPAVVAAPEPPPEATAEAITDGAEEEEEGETEESAEQAAQPNPQAASAADKTESGIRFQVLPEEALITLDGKVIGTVADLSFTGGLVPLRPGKYKVRLTREGYSPWEGEMKVGARTESLMVMLEKAETTP